MAGKTFRYEELTATQLAELDREHTLALMALSPLEVHGPHLPAGTDLLVALELQQRVIEQVSAEAGERMLNAHVAEAISMLEENRAGQPPFNVPVLWDLRFVERSR